MICISWNTNLLEVTKLEEIKDTLCDEADVPYYSHFLC